MTTRRAPGPARSRRPPVRRLLQFVVGLALCAIGVWASLQAGLGVSPWDVLHAGLSSWLGLSFGVVIISVGVLVLGLAALLGVRPGVGTLVNLVVIGVALDALLSTPWLDGVADAAVVWRALVLAGAVGVLGVGIALYIGAGFGAGPRDSLMVACYLKGLPMGASRAAIELVVLLAGWLLGGPVGVGTVVLALGLGPVTQLAFRLLRQEPAAAQAPAVRPEPAPSRPAS